MSKSLTWQIKELAAQLPDDQGNEWVFDGNCYGKDTNEFVYPANKLTESKRHKLTKICEGCPVMLTCRREAVRNQDEGWWGNMDPRERMQWAADVLFKEQLDG
jgi:hypothetical protein